MNRSAPALLPLGPLHPTALVVGLADRLGHPRNTGLVPPPWDIPPALRNDKGRAAWVKLFPDEDQASEGPSDGDRDLG
jgi:hypothetical protein